MNSQTLALKSLQLKAKDQAYTLFSGNHLSTLQGEGYDFSSLREYQLGDDIRRIHWISTAKMGRPYVKTLHSNRALSLVVCALLDGGMYFAEGNDKQKKLSEVATLLGYLTRLHSDLFTGIAYTQDHSIQSTPSEGEYGIEKFAETLYTLPLLDTKLDIKASLEALFIRLEKPSLIFVLSDFLEEIDLSLLAQKHEIIAVVIRDPREENLQLSGEFTLNNPKNKEKKALYINKSTRDYYLKEFKKHEEKRHKHFMTQGVKMLKILTNDDVLERFLTFFNHQI
jgi:uncharacterized protein (DUF58 family)